MTFEISTELIEKIKLLVQEKNNAELLLHFEDLHFANFPDDGTSGSSNWAMTFYSNGKFDGDDISQGVNGYGTWRVEDDRHCAKVDTVHG